MPKQSPVPEEVDKPFWDAANEDRLVVQNCTECDRLQHPPAASCSECSSGDNLEWKEMSGRGRVYGYGVMYDCPVIILAEDQPFNIAVVELEEDPGIKMLSHLPALPLTMFPWAQPSRWSSR